MTIKNRPLTSATTASADRLDIYQHVTDTIVSAIENGSAGKWVMPWHSVAQEGHKGFAIMPSNIDGRGYRGINVWLLMSAKLAAGYASDTWGTYKAWKAKGACVRKGEHGTLIVFWKPIEIAELDAKGKPKVIPIAWGYNVFNADQVEGYTQKAKPEISPELKIVIAESFYDAVHAKIKHGGNRACYMPSIDVIAMPLFTQFKTPEDYYSTRGHETVHWTGHATRMKREFGQRFGSDAYAIEELVAELGAAFLCAHLQISNEPRPDHAAYLANWLSVLKSDKKAIFTAASQAQKAVDFIIAKAEGQPAPADNGEFGK
jgi:antirestriction protein ArdC